MNFFTGTDSANTWLAAHPNVTGVILTQVQALTLTSNSPRPRSVDERYVVPPDKDVQIALPVA
jgi:hypothetical protein